jgi:hypothetical protein
MKKITTKAATLIDDYFFSDRLRRAVENSAHLKRSYASGKFQRIVEAFCRERKLQFEDISEGPDRPRFIGGISGRSGTTWLQQLITDQMSGSHAVIGEQGFYTLSMFRSAPYEYYQFGGGAKGRTRYLDYFHGAVSKWAYKRRRIYGFGLKGLMQYLPMRAIELAMGQLRKELQDIDTLSETKLAFGRFYIYLLNYYSAVLFGTAAPWISKEPPYGRHAHELLEMIPYARLVIMVRDGREVALSLYKRGWNDTIRGSMHRWAEFSKMTMNSVDQVPPGSVMLVRYDDLVLDFEKKICEIFKFLELPDPDPKTILSSGKSSIKPKTDSIRKWKSEMSASDQSWFLQNYGELNERIGCPI